MIDAKDPFQAALYLTDPWYISSINFTGSERRLDILVDFLSEPGFIVLNPINSEFYLS
jgi:hypothetical protein